MHLYLRTYFQYRYAIAMQLAILSIYTFSHPMLMKGVRYLH